MAIANRCATVLFVAVVITSGSAGAGITFLGEGALPGTTRDQSQLAGILEDGTSPSDLAGGLGSAIAYTGRGNLFVATPDRGPADGATTYVDRVYTIRIDVTPAGRGKYRIDPHIVGTKLLRRDADTFYTGSAAAFDPTGSTDSRRLDPEGVRVGRCGNTVFLSDEYGPYLYEFDLESGRRVRAISVPNKFLVDYPSANAGQELTRNIAGRQANRGMEGLAISPDGGKLTGIMQSPLIQDAGLDPDGKRTGLNLRMLQVDVDGGDAHEFVYVLDGSNHGVSEIVAVDERRFLVLERDAKAGADAAFKKIFLVDTRAATDIRAVKALPASTLPASVRAVSKTAFLDLLDPAFGLAGKAFPEKIEGLAFGPDLPDGRHVLVVTSDNDFHQNEPSRFFVFAFADADLPGLIPQRISADAAAGCTARPAAIR